jgi:hypothetical protein
MEKTVRRAGRVGCCSGEAVAHETIGYLEFWSSQIFLGSTLCLKEHFSSLQYRYGFPLIRFFLRTNGRAQSGQA